ncbi:MAG: threonine/serine exporter family protein [Phycisphaerae bacterium]|nr:threonine/serine exporter family protein [Phycisphaerae bacterium]
MPPVSPSAPAASRIAEHDALDLLIEIARSLHRYGTPSHRLEGILVDVGRSLGQDVAVFCVPTMITLTIGVGADQRSVMLRVEPGAPDLGHLAEMLTLLNRLYAGELGPAAAIREIRAIGDRRTGAPTWLLPFAIGGASFGAARLMGGGWTEMAAAALVGTVTGAAAMIAGSSRARLPLADFVSAATAVAAAGLLAQLIACDTSIVALASLIVLLPGLTLMTAMNELAWRHLVSGTARLLGALMSLVSLGFGAAIGDRLTTLLPPVTAPAPTSSAWTLPIALASAAVSIAMLFQARRRDFHWVALSVLVGYAGGVLGQSIAGPELGACLGAALVALTGNVVSRVRPVPAALASLPGLLVLVPGTMAFRGLQSLMEQDVVAGVGVASGALTTTGAIVAGLLLANTLLPAPRSL